MNMKYKNLPMLLKERMFLGRLPKLILVSFLKTLLSLIPKGMRNSHYQINKKSILSIK